MWKHVFILSLPKINFEVMQLSHENTIDDKRNIYLEIAVDICYFIINEIIFNTLICGF